MLLAVLLLPAGCWFFLLAQPAAAADDGGWLRVAHLSPDTPAADVTVAPAGSSTAAATDAGLRYGSVSAWHRLPAGTYTVAVRAAGVAVTTAPVLSARVDLPAGAARTVELAGRFADLRVAVQDDDLSPPAPGRARARVVDAASAGSLDVKIAGGPALASGLRPATSGPPTEVPAGPATLEVAAEGAPPQGVPVDLSPGSVISLLVLDGADGALTVRPVLDAGGPSDVPAGPVQAGGGGTAGSLFLPLLAAVLGGLAGALLLVTFRPGRPGPSRRLIAGRIALTLVAFGGAVVAVVATPPPPPLRAGPPIRVPGPVTVVGPAAATTAVPVRLQVAGVDAPVQPIGLAPAGALVPPADVDVAGWFTGGPAPGDVGPAVIAAHVDSVDGPGAFFRLRAVVPGDPVTVTRADGSVVRFVVTRVASYPKSAFPTAEVYGPTPDAELRLVTCGGAFDRAARSYVDDVVVFARRTG